MSLIKSMMHMLGKGTPSRAQKKSIRPTPEELRELGPKPSKKQIQKIFMRAVRILNDTELQNADYPLSLYLDYDDGPNPTPDELPNAQGDFGRSADNPIPVNGTTGEITYLSKLLSESGQRMLFQRAGSTDSKATKEMVDIFELISIDGTQKDTLYLDMYHLGQSKKTPEGYTLMEKLDGITGVSSGMIVGFPKGLEQHVFEEAIMTFGAPVVSPALRKLKKNKY